MSTVEIPIQSLSQSLFNAVCGLACILWLKLVALHNLIILISNDMCEMTLWQKYICIENSVSILQMK
jgi:hypothetical protein